MGEITRTLAQIATIMAVVAGASTTLAVPDFSDPVRVDEPIFEGGVARGTHPAVAANGDYRVVFWAQNFQAVVAARVAPDGTVVDERPVTIHRSQAIGPISVASDGDGFMAVWEEGPVGESSVFGVRLDGDLEPLSDPIELSRSGADAVEPSIACNGDGCLVAWKTRYHGSKIAMRRVPGAEGEAPADVVDVWEAAGLATADPSVASNGTGFLVAWVDDDPLGNVLAVRVDGSGDILDDAPIGIHSPGEYPRTPTAASDGQDYLVVWSEGEQDERDLAGARISADGDVLDDPLLAVSDAFRDQRFPDVAFDGSQYVVVWSDERNAQRHATAYHRRVAPDGTVEADSGEPLSTVGGGGAFSPGVAGVGDGAFAAWQDRRLPFTQIFGTRLDQQGDVQDTDGIFLSPAANDQSWVDVAASDEGFLAVWEDRRGADSGSGIWGLRLARDGTFLGEGPFEICDVAGDQHRPAVASNGSNYVVIWHDGSREDSRVHGTRLSADGRPEALCGDSLSLGDFSQHNAEIASNGTDYLAVWREDDSTPGSDARAVRGLRIPGDGAVSSNGTFFVAPRSGLQFFPTVAANDEMYLVSWEQSRTFQEDREILAAWVGASTDAEPSEPFTVVQGDGDYRNPDLASDGRDFLMTWHEWTEERRDIYAMRLRSGDDQPAGDAVRLTDSEQLDVQTAVTFTGGNFLVTWSRRPNPYEPGTIRGVELAADGTLLDPVNGEQIATGLAPAMSTSPSGVTVAAWSAVPFELGTIERVEISTSGELRPDAGDDVGQAEPDVGVWERGDIESRGCGCSVRQRPGVPVAPAALLLAALMWRRRRR